MFKSRLIDHKVKSRIYCVLFLALLTASNIWAEDDIVEIEPNGFSIVDVFRALWNFLTGLVA